MHNVIVPLVDNPTAFGVSLRDPHLQSAGEKTQGTPACLCTTTSEATPEQTT